MYLIQNTAFLVLLLHQCNVINGFNIFDMDTGFNYLNRQIDSMTSSFAPDTEIVTRWILQKLDHYRINDNRNFQMKYFERLSFWRQNGPIYLFLGGEAAASDRWMLSGTMPELAKETYGAMYVTEHRYYGDSKPFTKLDAENMKYLSAKQALADIADLIRYLKSLPMYKNSKVVVIGGSYAGNLAAWMKVWYPSLIDAALSSSAPVLAQKDLFEYLEKVNNNYERYGGTECLNKMRTRMENYDSMIQSSEGINQLKKDENICDTCDMTVLENQQLFFFSKTMRFASPYVRVNDVISYCRSANDKNYGSRFLNEFLKVNNSENKECFNYNFHGFVNYLKGDHFYQWFYQTCTEFGYFQTTTSRNQPFLNIPLEFYIKICSELFGSNFNEKRVDKGVEISNKRYGGLEPNVTKVVFTNGDMDPWSTIGVLKDLSLDAPALVIPRASHCLDLYSDMYGDSEELKAARQHVKYLIKKWIREDELTFSD